MTTELTPPMPADPTRSERKAERLRLRLQRKERRHVAKQGRKTSMNEKMGKGPGGKSGHGGHGGRE